MVQMRVPDPVKEKAEDVKDEGDFATLGEAVRYMVREGGYDV